MSYTANALRPLHHSVVPKNIRRPNNMERLHGVSHEQANGLEEIAVSIFCDCANVGVPFGRAILAVYLSGLEHGSTGTRDDEAA